MKSIHFFAYLIIIVGGLNWLLFGLFQWDIGNIFGGPGSVISRALYIIVGLAAVYELATHKGRRKECSATMGGKKASA